MKIATTSSFNKLMWAEYTETRLNVGGNGDCDKCGLQLF
jgi:hypothetical protein